jgi:pimeloyl-ACP methyl ester carboxylesterase
MSASPPSVISASRREEHDRLRRGSVPVEGVSLYYEEHGTGAPILCIHGTGSSSLLWGSAAAELGRHGRAIVYDRRGFSRSAQPAARSVCVRRHTDDAATLIDALEAVPAIVIGRSHGGEIAIDLALRYPDRVRALALLEGGGFSLSDAFRRWSDELEQRVLAAAEADMGSVGEIMFRGVLGDEGWDGLPTQVREVFTANGPAIAAEFRGGNLSVDEAELARIARPTLLLGGTGSPEAFADVTRRMAAAMPSARVEWVDGGHLIDPAHPAVLAFVDEVLTLR